MPLARPAFPGRDIPFADVERAVVGNEATATDHVRFCEGFRMSAHHNASRAHGGRLSESLQ